jgi:glutaredoxin
MILTLYSKPGCHLCDDLREFLNELAPELALTVREVDIEKDSTVFDRYRHRIPVLVMNGREIVEGKVSERDLRAALARRTVDGRQSTVDR